MNAPPALFAPLLFLAFFASGPCIARAAHSPIATSVRAATLPASVLALDAFWVPTQHIDEPLPAASSRFGYSVRMTGDLLVVGAPYANDGPSATTASGRAYIYRLVGGVWQFEKLLIATTPQTDAHFGLAVAVSTLTVPVVVVGEPDRDDANGADVGYVWMWQFVNGAWQNTDVKNVIHAGDRFGAALDVAGDYIAAGVPGFDGSPMPEGQNNGYVETLNRCNAPNPNNWCFAHSYGNGPLPANAHLGIAIAIAGEYLLSGASGDNPNNLAGAGSAWINNLHSVGPLATPIKLTDPTPAVHKGFGASVAAAGALFAVGSPVEDEPMGASDSGAVHVFVLSGNAAPLEVTLRSPIPQTSASFGGAIALTSNRIVIGEPNRNVFFFGGTSPDAGAAHVFRRFFVPSGYTWANVTTIYNIGDNDLFGVAVDTADGTQYAAGARNRLVDTLPFAGEVTVYRPDLIFVESFD